MTVGKFCAKCLSKYQEILSKTQVFGTGKYSTLGRTLYKVRDSPVTFSFGKMTATLAKTLQYFHLLISDYKEN